MMNRKVLLLCALLMVILLVGCGSSDSNEDTARSEDSSVADVSPAMTYELTSAQYAENNITIAYPQLMDASDSAKQDTINQLIEDDAIALLGEYGPDVQNLSVEIYYEVKLQTPGVLSIVYWGSPYVEGGSYPSNVYYASNIDIANVSNISLQDLVTVDAGLADKYRSSEYQPWNSEVNLADSGVLADILDGFTDEVLIEQFTSEVGLPSFYLTDSGLGFSIEIAHAAGDHLEMIIPYASLSENMNQDNPLWAEINSTNQ